MRPLPLDVLQIKVTLLEVEPAIWRRLLVPRDLTLLRFHETIQAGMGWFDSHLHQFEAGGIRYGQPDPLHEGFAPGIRNEATVKLSSLVDQGIHRFTYLYDFGDDWRHEIVVEKSVTAAPQGEYPLLLEGQRRCPPEDCGGPPGYQAFLEAMANPDHPDHADTVGWYGDGYDPDDIERDTIDAMLSRIARSRKGELKSGGKPRRKRRSGP